MIGPAIIDTFYTDTSWAQLPNGIYQFAITSVHTNGVESIAAFSIPVEKTQASNDPELVEITQTKLLGNYPNPFNPSTIINFSLNTENTEGTEVLIYNLKGQMIRKFSILNIQSSIVWDGTDENNQPVTSGIYFYKLKVGEFEETRKMILMK